MRTTLRCAASSSQAAVPHRTGLSACTVRAPALVAHSAAPAKTQTLQAQAALVQGACKQALRPRASLSQPLCPPCAEPSCARLPCVLRVSHSLMRTMTSFQQQQCGLHSPHQPRRRAPCSLRPSHARRPSKPNPQVQPNHTASLESATR